MRVSRKTDYSLRALFTLVERYGQGPVSIRELAELNETPKRFLEHIMLDMKAQGWVTSAPGKNGGYTLSLPPEDIRMGQVVRYFDGLLAPINCVSIAQYEPCSLEKTCRFRRVFLRIRNDTAHLMDHLSLADAYAGNPVEPREVLEDIMDGGAGI